MKDKTFLFQHYVVVFLDVLGQSESLRKIRTLPTNDDEKERFIQQIKQSTGKVVSVRKDFQEFFDTEQSQIPNTQLVRPECREDFIASQKTEIYYYGMSDALVIAVPLKDDHENCTAMNSVHCALMAASGLGLFELSKGIPVRAGIDVGIATQIGEQEIYGTALARAVYLEGQLAEYPRFLVGNEIVDYLEWIENRDVQTPFGLNAKDLAQRCRKMLIQDADGRLMLDFLGEHVVNAPGKPISKATVESARQYVLSQYQRYSAEENEKLASRYFRLMHYFQFRRPIWENA